MTSNFLLLNSEKKKTEIQISVQKLPHVIT